MTVFKKIVVIKVNNPRRPTEEILKWSVKNDVKLGIDIIPLSIAPGLKEATLKFVCSDNNPITPRTMEHLDRLLSTLDVRAELKTHPKDPVATGKMKHDIQITANLEDPNIEDRHISHAKRVHKEHVSMEQVKMLNQRIHRYNMRLSDTSDDNSDKKKFFKEEERDFEVGEIERG